jgi:cytoskeletal protein CcmA (bactofilin family)
MNIGPSIVIKGEISGEEDLAIAGRVEGRIHLSGCRLTLAPDSHIQGEIDAEIVIAAGRVHGRIATTGRLDVHATAAIEGELTTPSLTIADGAKVHGRVDMPARPAARHDLAVAV